MRIQPKLKPVDGKPQYRDRTYSALLHQIAERVQQDADEYDCSRSFVVATILGKHYRIGAQADFRADDKKVINFRKRA